MQEDFAALTAAAPEEIRDDAAQSLALVVAAGEGLEASGSEAEANEVAEQMALDGAELRDDGSYLRLLEFQAENCPQVDEELGSYP